MAEQTKADLMNEIYHEIQALPLEAARDILDYVKGLKAKLDLASSDAKLDGELVGQERREYLRLKTTVPIAYKLLKSDAAAKRKVLSRDISGGGTRIVLFFKDRVDLGDELELDIVLPLSPSAIKTRARVVRVFPIGDELRKGYEVGVEFIDIPLGRRSEIERFVQSGLEE